MGLSQALDWSGKARASRDAVAVRDQLAQLRGDKARARLLADSVNALVAHAAARSNWPLPVSRNSSCAILPT